MREKIQNLKKTLSIVILNWNGVAYLKQFLPLLIEKTQNPDVEIVVADNGSTDDSTTVLKKNFPTVKLITFDTNYGFAEGYNKALRQLDSDYYVLLNSDVEVTDNWLSPMLKYMNEHEDVAACQPKIRSFAQRDCFEHAGAAGGFVDKYGYPFCRGRILGTVERDNGQYDSTQDIFWATGACLFIRSKAFWEAGGLDADFFAHMEEIDLCWRLNNRGWRIVCVPESAVYHVGGGTLSVENPRKTYLNFRNNLLMLYKNLPENQLQKTLFVRWWLDYAAAFQLFITGKRKNAQSAIKARRDYKRMKPDFKTKRQENIKQAKTEVFCELYTKSIVVGYYLKGKKEYDAF